MSYWSVPVSLWETGCIVFLCMTLRWHCPLSHLMTRFCLVESCEHTAAPFLPWLPHKLNSRVLPVMEGSSLCYGTNSCTVRSPQATPVPQCWVGSSRGSDKCSVCCPPVMGRLVPECESRFHVWLGPSHMELHISPSFLGSVSCTVTPPHDYLVCEILSSMCKLKNCDLVTRDLMVQDTHTHKM